jgi:uncharacterized membrane protein
MIFILLGFLIFISIHLLPTFTKQRQKFINALGYWKYLVLFSIFSLIGFLLILHGYSQVDHNTQLWQPTGFSHVLAMIVMPFVFILIISTYLTGYIQAKLKHPMLIGTAFWSIIHLLANGDLASSLLFGGFFAYAIIAILLAKPHDSLIPTGKPSLVFDLIAIVVGIGLYALVAFNHLLLFGVAL